MLTFIRHPESQLKRYHFKPQLKECHEFTVLGAELRERQKRTLVIKGELARVKAKLRKSRVGFGFLKIFQKPLGGHARPAKRHTLQTQVLGFLHEPPGGRGLSVRRHEHNYAIFDCFDIFGVPGIWP
ncbi:hypothetical protein DEO72_LG8g1903 [Vigna unguiculata]|uniref:Uncharacterized protein n=1 Tax=Vigna unguiculata TaxID=3917 RepID=A0A4D6MSW8_VIGUN|nr:hypothetical protein DEO72_LG8g1903 [Vigna unguiculata]